MGLARTLFESQEPLIRSHEDVMMAVARAEDLMRKGERSPDLAIAEDLAAALRMLARVKHERKLTVDQYLAQRQMFERELTPFQERLLKHFEGIGLSSNVIGQFLGDYGDAVVASPPPQQTEMFVGPRPTKEGLFDATVRRQAEGDLFAYQAEGEIVSWEEALTHLARRQAHKGMGAVLSLSKGKWLRKLQDFQPPKQPRNHGAARR